MSERRSEPRRRTIYRACICFDDRLVKHFNRDPVVHSWSYLLDKAAKYDSEQGIDGLVLAVVKKRHDTGHPSTIRTIVATSCRSAGLFHWTNTESDLIRRNADQTTPDVPVR
jgi:hypothetical protein